MKKAQYTHEYNHTLSHGLTMADSQEYQLTPKAEEILEALREDGEWNSRSALATKLTKKALNKWDIVLLSKLTEAGLIETRQIPHHGPIGYEWQYRAAPIDQA